MGCQEIARKLTRARNACDMLQLLSEFAPGRSADAGCAPGVAALAYRVADLTDTHSCALIEGGAK